MAETVFLYVAMFIAVFLHGKTPLLSDAIIANFAFELLKSSGAADSIEHAAFVVRKPGGVAALLPWPDRGFYGAKWTGPLPNNVVAVIHTHPRNRPMPSAQDRAEAKRLQLPFYVVSRAGLCVADAANAVYCASRIPWLLRGEIRETALNWTRRAAGAS